MTTIKNLSKFVTLSLLLMAWCALAQAADAPAVRVLFDFTSGKAGSFEGGKIAVENIPQGKSSLLADKDAAAICEKPQNWSGYDLLKIDVFNPADAPKMLLVEIRDAQTKDYWTRVNYTTVVPPGRSTVTLPTDIYVGEKSRPGRALLKSKVTFMALAPQDAPLMFEKISLEKLQTASVLFDGLRAFSFGDGHSPVMAGFTAVTPAAAYDKKAGYGWLGQGNYLHAFNAMQPDSLFENFIATDDVKFQEELPSGKYHVLLNIDCPGGYWGEVQQYTSRQVLMNGKVAVDEKMTFDDFKKTYFRNAHREDLPGLDTFHEYVQPMFNIKEFDIDVSDGKAVFEFRGEGRWPISLSAMVIYPIAKAEAGKKFWAWTTAQRQAQFNDYFKQIVPQASGAKPPATGYRLFSRNFMTPPGAFDGPRENEAIPAEGLSLTLAQGEEGALTLSVQPGSDLGGIDLAVSSMRYADIQKHLFPPLKDDVIQTGWLDYRITRVTAEGTVYQVSPRYWHATPAPAAPKVTRTFWLRIKPPVGTKPGPYEGLITIKPEHGAAQSVPLKITVLPFALDEITDVAAGPFGCNISLPWDSADSRTELWEEQMLEKSLKAIREAGCTTATGLPQIGMKAAGGKVTLDFTLADWEMKLLRKLGFTQMIGSYGIDLGYNMYGTENGPDEAFARSAGFADMKSFLKVLYGQIESHAKAEHWLPIAWNICDEPIGDAAKASGRNAALHQEVAKELGLVYSTFTGATSMEGRDPKEEHYELVKDLGMPSLNLHDEASIQLIHDQGHRFAFYNDGNRWTYGRYMKALVVHYGLAFRTTWHFNVAAGDPYYALDCREDDYCWYNTDENQTMVPALSLLSQIQPGLNDYRYLSTLERLLKEKADSPAAVGAKKVYDEQLRLTAGKDRTGPKDPAAYEADRRAVVKAILALLGEQQ